MIHCKRCVEAGRTVAPQPAQQAPPPMQPPPPYAYGPMGEMGFIPPSPRGVPDPGLFKQGALGSFLCLIFTIPGVILSLIDFGAMLSHNYSMLSGIGNGYYAFSALQIAELICLVFFAQGFRGFQRNFGDPRSGTVVPFIYIAVGITMAFEITFVLADAFNWYSGYSGANYYFSPLGLMSILYEIPLAIAFLFTFAGLRSVRIFFPPGSQPRDEVNLASYLFLGASIFMFISWLFYYYVSAPPIAGIMLIIAFFVMYRIFSSASHQVTQLPPYAPVRTV